MIRRTSTRVVYTNRWMTFHEDRTELPDGTPGLYSYVERPDVAVVIPAERDGFWLVEQYRYPIGSRSWEFPLGSFPAGESGTPEQLAHRELTEETGLAAAALTHLGVLHPAVGTIRQRADVWLATDLTPGESSREPEEQDMRQSWFPRPEFEDMIRTSVITDDLTIAAYTLLLLRR